MNKRVYVTLVLSCLVLLAACSRLDTASPSVETPASTANARPIPEYVPVALRGDLQTTSTDESVDAYFDERTRTFSNGETLTYWVADNMVVEGDMILHEDAEAFEAILDEYEKALKENSTLESQSVFANPHCITQVITCLHYTQNGRRWPGGKVYYDVQTILDNFNGDQRDEIFAAMTHIKNKTGGKVSFREVKKENRSKYPDRIVFKNESGAGCYSRLGKVGGRQTLMLGGSCANYLGTVIHELGHAVGLLHEHQRCDRDKYIDVNDSNLKSKGRSNFGKECGGDATTYDSFDYLSIMMYSVTTTVDSFVKDTSRPMFEPTRTLPKYPGTDRRLERDEIGSLDFLSRKDILGLKARY